MGAGDGLPSILAIEQATLTAVPSARLRFDGPFILRAFLGGTGRANAACCFDPRPDPGLEARIDRAEGFYRRLGLTPRFRSTPLDPQGLDAALAARGYRSHDESQVICGPLAGMAAEDPEVEVLDGPTEEWIAVLGTSEHQVPARRAEKLRMPELIGVPAAWLILRIGGVATANAFLTADGELAGLFDLGVRPEFRRRGLGRRIVAAGGAWAAARGARFAYAQVASTNAASLTLNAGLGLRERYRYRYWLPG